MGIKGNIRQQKTLLETFWLEFAIYGKRKIDSPSPKGKELVLKELIRLSNYVCGFPTKDLHMSRRENFNSLKKTHKWQFCFACGEKPHVRHHIILIKNGGSNSGKNIVRLCNSCHAEIHPWLKEQNK